MFLKRQNNATKKAHGHTGIGALLGVKCFLGHVVRPARALMVLGRRVLLHGEYRGIAQQLSVNDASCDALPPLGTVFRHIRECSGTFAVG